MQPYRFQITGPGPGGGRGLVARILYSVVAVIGLAVAAFLGAFVFLAALGFFAVAVLVVTVRLWWLRRAIERAARQGERPSSTATGGPRDSSVIEGEYHIVVREEDERGHGDDPGGGR